MIIGRWGPHPPQCMQQELQQQEEEQQQQLQCETCTDWYTMAFATTFVAQDNDMGGASFQDGFLDVDDEYQLKMVVIELITTQSHHCHQWYCLSHFLVEQVCSHIGLDDCSIIQLSYSEPIPYLTSPCSHKGKHLLQTAMVPYANGLLSKHVSNERTMFPQPQWLESRRNS